MKLLVEIRNKTGISQQKLAEFLNVTRSQVNMAEQGLRNLPKEAFLKLVEMDKAISATGKLKIPAVRRPDDETFKKLKGDHEFKMQGHLNMAKGLKLRLNKLLKSQAQEDTKQEMIAGLSETSLPTSEDNSEERWMTYHGDQGRNKIQKNNATIHALSISIDLHLGYAAVHEKILKEHLSGK